MLPTAADSDYSERANLIRTDESLAVAFADFTRAAGSLEHSYLNLQSEVVKLRKQLEETNGELKREREVARQSKALAEMSAVLAHEIRNPLASLELFAELLRDSTELRAETRTIVTHVQAGLRTLAATVNNVLQFHAAAAQELVPTNLANLTAMTLEFLGPLAEQAGVRMEFRNEIEGIHIAAEPHRLQQVLLNLVMNALRHMQRDGTITITGTSSDCEERVYLTVADTGCGVSQQNRERIFEPGFTTRRGSVGLGLAVCKKIMEQHGGTIELAATTVGATFVLGFKRLLGDMNND